MNVIANNKISQNDLSRLIHQLGETALTVLKEEDDPSLKATVKIIQDLGDRISIFLFRIQELLKSRSRQPRIAFLSDYFFTNYARISENNKASRHIIAYVVKHPQWLKEHSLRIIEFMKSLYSDLLAMTIECEEMYKRRYSSELDFDFGLDFHKEEETDHPFIDEERALQILDIKKNPTRDELKKTFRELAKKYHPDLNPGADPEVFMVMKQAFTVVLKKMK